MSLTRFWQRFSVVGASLLGALAVAGAALAIEVVEPPAGPTGFKAVAGNTTVALSWRPPVGSVNSEVIRDGVVIATKVIGTSWSTTSVRNGVSYAFVVRSVDAKGVRSKPSTELTVTPLAVPPALTGVAVRHQDRQATVTWARPNNPLASKVRVSVDGKAVLTVAATVGVATVRNLVNDTSVLVSLEVLNANGTASKAVTVTAVPTDQVQRSPFGLAPTGGDARVDLVWLPTAGTSEYRLWRDGKLLRSVAGTLTSAADTAVQNTVVYKYQIQAVVGGQVSALSPARAATPLAVPAGPGPVIARGRDKGVLLTWPEPADPVAAYEVLRGGVKIADVPGTALTFTDTGLVNGTTYRYTLIAVNANGAAGPVSVAVSAVPKPPPATPVAPLALAGDEQVSLTWKAAGGITRWIIVRNGVRLGGVLTGVTAFVDTSALNGVTYKYQLIAVSAEEQESVPSPVATAVPKAVPPKAPVGVRADPGDTEVTLGWTANLPAAALYRVYRGTTLVAETPDRTARDVALTNGTTYRYTVTAVDGRGFESARSVEVAAVPVAPSADAPRVISRPGHEEVVLDFSTVTTKQLRNWRVVRDGVEIERTAAGTVTDRGLSDGRTYRYQVQALYDDGTSSAMSMVSVAVPTAPWRALSVGGAFACGVHAEGGVRCWGGNESRQLGDGSTVSRVPGPVLVAGPTGVTAVSAGPAYACAVDGGAALWCWGAVPGATTPRMPAVVPGLTGVTAVDAGPTVVCVVAAGEVRCLGRSTTGQLGTATVAATPVKITLPSAATDVTVGGRHACARLANGSVACWGGDDRGQSSGTVSANRTTAVVVPGLSGVRGVSAGTDHTCVLAANAVSCFGAGDAGQLGRAGKPATGGPATVFTSTGAAVSAGDRYTCVTLLSGQARCFGAGTSGQLGDGGGVDRATPVAVLNLDLAVRVEAGAGGTTCALTRNRSVWCFGANDASQVGTGETAITSAPSRPVAGLTGATQLVVGGDASCLIRAGAVWCWGPNAYGAAGTTPGVPVTEPAKVTLPGTLQPRNVSVGARTACVTTTSSELYCWGANDTGQAGAPVAPTVGVSKVDLAAVSEAFVGVEATCARKADATLWCFGRSDLLGAGLSGTTARPAPAQVLVSETAKPLTGISVVAMGDRHTCVADRYSATVATSGAVRCFGATGTAFAGRAARPVAGLVGVQYLAAGRAHTCAAYRTTAWTAACWGANNAGQLGLGDTVDRAAPAAVASMSATRLSAGGDVTCVKSPNAQGWCFGAGTGGATGNGLFRPAEATPQVLYGPGGGIMPTAQISTNGRTSCAVLASGTGTCWGTRGFATWGEGPAFGFPLRPVVD